MKGKSKKPDGRSRDGHKSPGDVLLAPEAGLGTIERADEVAEPEKVLVDGDSPDPAYPHYRVEPGKRLKLSQVDPDESEHYKRKGDVKRELKKQRLRIRDLQARLFAEHKQSLLIVLQAIDTGGKDGTIRIVFQGVNPQGCQVYPFKVPSIEELSHDFLWRYHL